MARLLVLIVVLILLTVAFLVIRSLYRHYSGANETETREQGNLIATWAVMVSPHDDAMTVWCVRRCVINGRQLDYDRHPVGSVKNDSQVFTDELERLKDEAQRRCRTLNAQLSTAPGEA